MGDAKVKQQPFFGNQTHHHQHHPHHHHHHHHHHLQAAHDSPIATTSKSNTSAATMATVVMDAKHATSGLSLGSPQQPGKEAITSNNGTPVTGKDKSPASAKYEQLKLRKQELEKRLNEKYSLLQQIKREEAQLIGVYPSDFSCGIGPSTGTDGLNGASSAGVGGVANGTAPTLRRKIGTSFKLPENLLNNKEDDINKLLLEKQIQQQISEASLRLANDTSQPKSLSMLRHRARTDSFPGIATNYDSGTATTTTEQSLKISPLSGSGSIASGGSGGHHLHHNHPHHHHIGPGPARMNRLIQQQIGANYSPPPPPTATSTTPGYVLSPASAGPANGGQAFVYDAKVISRLQGGPVNNNPRSPPQGPPPQSALNDQNYCPNVTPGAFDYGTHDNGSVPAGLGGYWMTLDSGEKIWCSVDSRQFSSLDRKQQGGGSMKLSRTSTKLGGTAGGKAMSTSSPAIKSSSLGNFQEYIGKSSSSSLAEDNDGMDRIVQPDAISVTSGSSEHKKREKVWRETSLDSPVVKHKALPPLPAVSSQPPGQMSPSSIGSGGSHLLGPQSPPYTAPPQQQQEQPQVLPPYHSRHQHPPPPPLPPPNQHHYHHSQQLLQNRLQHPGTTVPTHPQQLDLLPQNYPQPDSVMPSHLSPSFSHHRMSQHQQQQQQLQHDSGYYPGHGTSTLASRHPNLVISPTLSHASSHTLTTSPTATTIVQALPVVGGRLMDHENGPSGPSSPTPSSGSKGQSAVPPPSDIQMESPKNMTVVQQGKIMPYKEVTKPFEMSDFYKYSTKYRQKQQQQQQQQQQQHHHHQQPSPSEVCSPGGGNESDAPGGDGIHKGIYQPPNRSICQPIVNNYN
uniref:Cytohesin Ubiquitin Protein Inducing domain-containing protein n=1 Tax=Anopheles farauti TaxID=69004 RepID=A0A182QZX6_9DIPT